MKNKNGFTLIEILVTIGILSILTTIVGVSVVQILNNNKNKEIEKFGDKICAAALTYVDYQGINESLCETYNDLCEVTYTELLQGKDNNFNDLPDGKDKNDGFIKKDLVNPENKKIVSEIAEENDSTVAADITFKDGEKVCKYHKLS